VSPSRNFKHFYKKFSKFSGYVVEVKNLNEHLNYSTINTSVGCFVRLSAILKESRKTISEFLHFSCFEIVSENSH
jgi:hypothetical protein